MERLLLSEQETQQILGIGRTKFHELKKSGHLVQVRIGRRSLITAESVRRYVESLSAVSD
jgi:excisionase family DNA binding protein